jgi:hypothetical protein
MIREVHRVLKPEGSFHILVREEPLSGEGVSVEEFRAFAKHADLYSGGGCFVETARRLGFKDDSHLYPDAVGGERRLISLFKIS